MRACSKAMPPSARLCHDVSMNRDRLSAAEHAQRAFAHDRAGEERLAVSHYRAALSGHLEPSLRRECLLGLGSTLRTIGEYEQAHATLTQGRQEFPAADEFPVFLAMTCYNLGQHHEAMRLLLTSLADTTGSTDLRAYDRAIRLYAGDLERQW